jgi:O-antigen ligase
MAMRGGGRSPLSLSSERAGTHRPLEILFLRDRQDRLNMSTRVFDLNSPYLSQTHPRVAVRIARATAVALICFSIIVPVINLSSAMPWFKIEQLAVLPIILAYAWLLLAGRAKLISLNPLFLIGFLYSLCILVSLAYGSLFLGHTAIVRDIYEVPKILFPVIFLTLGVEANLNEQSLRRLLDFLSLTILLICLYAWAQWMNLGISDYLARFYSGGEHIEGALSHYRRVYSTMGNPNVLGQLLTWSIGAFTLAALFRVGDRFRNLAMSFVCVVTLVMTGSRYGLLNTGLVLLLILCLPSSLRRQRLGATALLLVLFSVFGGVAYFVASGNATTFDRLQTLRNPLTTDSYRARVDALWRDAGEEFIQSPFFGHGPAKAIFSDVITDSEYLDVLKEFGLVGFFIYLGYFAYPLVKLWQGLKHARAASASLEQALPATFWALRLSFIMVVTALAMNIGMSTLYNPALQGFLWLWLGIGISAGRSLYLRKWYPLLE